MVALLHHVTSISLFLVLKFLVGAPLLKVKSTFCWNRNSANSVAEIPGFVEDLSRFTGLLMFCSVALGHPHPASDKSPRCAGPSLAPRGFMAADVGP